MAYFTGTGGSVTFNSVTVPVKTWSGNFTCSYENVTTTASPWKSGLAGEKGGQFTATVFYDPSVAPLSAFEIGTTAAATLNLGASGDAITGSFMITASGVTNPATNPIEVTITGDSDGEVTLP